MVAPIEQNGPAQGGPSASTDSTTRMTADDPGRNGHESKAERLGDEARELWQAARQDLNSVGREAQRLASLRWHRVRLATKELGWSLAIGVWLALVGVVMTIVASILIVVGLAQGISSLAGNTPWVGALGVGVAIVAAMIGGFLMLKKRFERRFAEVLMRRFGAPTDSPTQAPTDAPTVQPTSPTPHAN